MTATITAAAKAIAQAIRLHVIKRFSTSKDTPLYPKTGALSYDVDKNLCMRNN